MKIHGQIYHIESHMGEIMASQGSSPSEYILSLVNDSLKDIESDNIPLSSIIRKCNRIAHLRNDFINLWWLEWEMINIGDEDLSAEIVKKIAPHLTKEEKIQCIDNFLKHWSNERKCDTIGNNLEIEHDKNFINKGVGEIEIEIKKIKKVSAESFSPQSRDMLKNATDALASSYEVVLERIRGRVHSYLSETEKQLIFGQINADIFERNRKYVDSILGKLNPEVISQFVSIYRRMQEKDPESYAQAATSCRRIIKSLADALYPPSGKSIRCADNKDRILSDDKYINRLNQYVHEQTAHSSSSELLLADVELLGKKIEKLYDLTCKGAHAEISEFEINQCVIQTYLLAGDLLRISENKSAITVEKTQLGIAASNSDQSEP